MKVDQAWLDFLRDQFPKGSQVRSWELDDPEHISIGTLEQIDEDGGSTHAWRMGPFENWRWERNNSPFNLLSRLYSNSTCR